jgi:hypothetical protein
MKPLFLLLAIGVCTVLRGQDTKPVNLSDVLGPNNTFNDPVMGVSLTYPAGWEVTGGMRWGLDYRENTFRFRAQWPLQSSPSLYYQGFRPDSPRPANVAAWLLEAAKKKEASRQQGGGDYRNDPQSVTLRNFGDRPGLSYLATFTQNGRKMAEYNVRVVGQKAYVMFFTFGPLDDILSIRTEIDQMAESVRVP